MHSIIIQINKPSDMIKLNSAAFIEFLALYKCVDYDKKSTTMHVMWEENVSDNCHNIEFSE